jgi:hypothetical protein
MRRTVPLLAIVVTTSFALGGIAFANHDFDDVPTSNPFHADISWAVDEGITTGFADGGYHPNEPVSRQAMAAFLHRLSGTVPSVGRVVDANLLRGQNPEQLQPAVYSAVRTTDLVFDASTPSGADTIVTIPSVPAGSYLVHVSGTYRTTWEEAVVSCFVGVPVGSTVPVPAHSLERVHAGTELNLSDWGRLSGSAVIDMSAAGAVTLRCHWQGLSGVDGDLIARNTSIIATEVQDL